MEADALYAVFTAYPLTATTGCACCVSAEDQARVRRVALDRLEVDDLERFAFKAMSTWGDDRDYRHFLPRILELAASDGGRGRPGFDLGLIGRKLTTAGFASWPVLERAAVTAWFRGMWTTALADVATAPRIVELERAIAEVVPLAELLAQWAATPHTTLHVAEALTQLWAMKHGPEHDALRAWLRAPARGLELEAAFVAALDTPAADQLARAHDLWELLVAER